MFRIWGLLAIIVIVIAILDVWKREHSLEKRLLWSIVIIVFPFLGALAWYLVSRKVINL